MRTSHNYKAGTWIDLFTCFTAIESDGYRHDIATVFGFPVRWECSRVDSYVAGEGYTHKRVVRA